MKQVEARRSNFTRVVSGGFLAREVCEKLKWQAQCLFDWLVGFRERTFEAEKTKKKTFSGACPCLA